MDDGAFDAAAERAQTPFRRVCSTSAISSLPPLSDTAAASLWLPDAAEAEAGARSIARARAEDALGGRVPLGVPSVVAGLPELILLLASMDAEGWPSVTVPALLRALMLARQPALKPAEAAVLRIFIGGHAVWIRQLESDEDARPASPARGCAPNPLSA
jgi:hypothetical protein